ncbi:CDP-diacylglycerol--glycerol-3-phosphate 3-phosphatidyltransferase/cardiolipin synthase [Novosphingobium sp. ST904]|nr:CDP-diacylglycerol--glycerol-3-phosphate 3-phosphatidyltransferase/cardiolipin synthase [Novosphingobium sp. ST904]
MMFRAAGRYPRQKRILKSDHRGYGQESMLTLPNILTLSRIVTMPFLAFLLWWPKWEFGYALAFGVYCLMGITDYFDGYLARSSGTVSKLGVFLDPIADKIMVAAVILVLTAQGVLTGPYVGDMHVIAGLIILVREIAVSGLREFLGSLQVSVPVSRLAKWKTTFQLISLGALILGVATPWWNLDVGAIEINIPHTVGLTTLWGAAVLTLITGWDYLRVGLKHMD